MHSKSNDRKIDRYFNNKHKNTILIKVSYLHFKLPKIVSTDLSMKHCNVLFLYCFDTAADVPRPDHDLLVFFDCFPPLIMLTPWPKLHLRSETNENTVEPLFN